MNQPSDDAGAEMHRQVPWLRPSDRSIVRTIADYGGHWVKPATLALNLPYTRNHISARCRTLTDHGLLERHTDAAGYRVTERGQRFLADELDADDLRDADA